MAVDFPSFRLHKTQKIVRLCNTWIKNIKAINSHESPYPETCPSNIPAKDTEYSSNERKRPSSNNGVQIITVGRNLTDLTYV